MKAARITFTLAGIYGLLILSPFLFLERKVAAATPGGLTHPEYYYGFLGAALVMQLVYLAIGREPARLRPLMPLCALAKLAFFVPVLILWFEGRVHAPVLDLASVDLLLACAFIHAWRVTPEPGGGLPSGAADLT